MKKPVKTGFFPFLAHFNMRFLVLDDGVVRASASASAAANALIGVNDVDATF